MNLEEFRKHVEQQREESKAEALAILSATIRKENQWEVIQLLIC